REELLQDGGERRRRYVVGLTRERAESCAGDHARERQRRLAQHRHALLTADHQRRHLERGGPPGRQREVAHDGRVVGERLRHRLKLGPHRQEAEHRHEQAGHPDDVLHVKLDRISVAALRDELHQLCVVVHGRHVRGRADHERCSYKASFLMLRPLAAASRASAAPDEMAYTNADPPASRIKASRSSISRSTAYGAVSPLSPRARRSYTNTLKSRASSGASFGIGPKARLQNAPSTRMTGGPPPPQPRRS